MANWKYPRTRAVFDALNNVICSLEGLASYLDSEVARSQFHLRHDNHFYLPPAPVMEQIDGRPVPENMQAARAKLDRVVLLEVGEEKLKVPEKMGPAWLDTADGYWQWWVTLREFSVVAKKAVDEAAPDLDAGIVNMFERPSHQILEALCAGERSTNVRITRGWNPLRYPKEVAEGMVDAARVLAVWFERLRPTAERTGEPDQRREPQLTSGEQKVWDSLAGKRMLAKEIATGVSSTEPTVRGHIRAIRGKRGKYSIRNKADEGYWRPDAPPRDQGAAA